MPSVAHPPPSPSPPRHSTHVKKGATRFEKEVAAAGGKVDEHPNDPKNIGPWRIGRTIGKGAAGRVKIAKHSKTGQFAAVKILPKSTLSTMASRLSLSSSAAADSKAEKYAFGLEREIVIMKLIDHPNVMSLHDVWETDKELFLILEYVEGGELFDYLVSRGRLPASEALRYFQQIIHGVDYCHRFNICHRDLKPENLLLDSDKNIKIADFGMAALEPSDRKLETSCGSPHYASPEIVAGLAYHGAASDIWSCGIILFALLTGRLPFDDENIRVLLQKVKLGKFVMPPDMPTDAKDLISKMLVVDPEKRITMPEILSHPFFNMPVNFGPGKRVPHVEPPTLDEIARPVASERDIEKDILKNLRTLWHGAPEKDIVRALLSDEKTWEKAFYTLLVKYKQKHLENLGGDSWNPPRRATSERKKTSDRESTTSRRTRPASTQSHATTPGTPSSVTVRKPVPREGKIDVPEVQARGAASSSVHNTPKMSSPPPPAAAVEHNFSPVRPAPPSPQKQSSANGTPQRSRTVVGGPRPQSVHVEGAAAASPTPPSRTRSQRVAPSIASSTPTTSTNPRTSIFSNHNAPTSPQLPQITFQEPSPHHPIVHGLGLGVASSTPGTPTPGTPVVPSSPNMGGIVVPTVGDAALQKFLNDMASQLTALQSSTAQQHSNHGSPNLEDQFADSHEDLVTAPKSSGGGGGGARAGGDYALTDPRGANGGGGGGGGGRQPLRNSQAANMRNDPGGGAGVGRKQRELGRKASGTVAMPGAFEAKRKSKPAPLDLSPLSPQMSSFLSPGMSPNFSSAPPSPMLSPGPEFDNKQSWFSNLFNWKPATSTLISSSDVLVTRSECAQLLEAFGAQVSLEDVDGWGTLRCKLDEIQDLSGQMIHKPVKFRVEFLPHSSMLSSPSPSADSPKTPTVTSITLVQEKGALSAFKVVCSRLRQEWSLCEINSPAANQGSRFAQSQQSPLPEFREGW